MCWFSPMVPNCQCHMGIPWLLPHVTQFQVCTITQEQLTALTLVGAWGDVEKPHQDMAVLLIVLSLAVGCEWIFWTDCHVYAPQKVCLPTLVDVDQKLLLLTDEGADWPYAYIRMNDAMAHALLSSKGHIGVMTGDLPSWNTCGHLYQLCVWQLLQCGGWMVCPDGLNGGLEPLLFNFKELLLWNVANVGESSRDRSRMDVDIGNAVHVASPPSEWNTHLVRVPGEWWSNYHWPP